MTLHFCRWVAPCLGALAALGCVSSSISDDMRRVQSLTHLEDMAKIAETQVEAESSDDVHRMLETPLDADKAVRIALLNNRELRATLREMGIARGRLIQAGLLPNPRVEAELLPERNTQLELRAEYDITSAVLAPIRSRAAKPDLEAARYRAAAAVVDLGYRVRVAFFRVQSVEQRRAITAQVLDSLAAARDAVTAMGNAGNLPALDVVSQDTAYERARIMVAQSDLDVATERERLQRLLGLHGGDTAWRVQSELPEVPQTVPALDQAYERRALEASLDLRETKERLESLARRAGLNRMQGWLPDISADVHSLQGNPEPSTGGASDRDWRYGAGVSLTVPLFDRRQGTTTALEAEFDALMERYYGMAIDIRSAAREARSRVVSAHARALQYQQIIVPAQQRVTEQTLLQYNAMQLGIFQLLAARREQLDVELAYVETLREYWSSMAELEAIFSGRRVMAADSRPSSATATEAQAQGGH